MKKINIVRKNIEFDRIIKLRNSYKNECYVINIDKNNNSIPKFGISVSKHLGNAVFRNRTKRQIKNIIDTNKNIYQKQLNYIIIVRQGAVAKSYWQLETSLIELFNKIMKENESEEK